MIDLEKFGFSIMEDDAEGARYENGLLEIQHWKAPDVYAIILRRDSLIEWRDDLRGGGYAAKEGFGESERKLAELLVAGNFHSFPLYVGAIKGETFFEILINSVCADADKLIQCGS